MAEDDEIDVLGDFDLDNFLTKTDSSIYGTTSLVSQNTELLNCDYTIHPQWLLDKPSTNPDCWFDTNVTESPEKNQDTDSLGHVYTENSISDESGWTEKEKDLLLRGIEIFGKSNVRLSQFIGSKTASEVKYYLKNYYIESKSAYSTIEDMGVIGDFVDEILDDTQIPASIEEVIAAVSTAKPTVQVKKNKKKDENESNFLLSSQKSSFFKGNKVKQKKTQNVKQKTVKIGNEDGWKAEAKVEITTGKGLAVPICEGEEIVKIRTEDSDTDTEIDVEDSDETNSKSTSDTKQIENSTESKIVEPEKIDSSKQLNKQSKQYIDLSILDDSLVEELTTLEIPKKEMLIAENEISELEKAVHSEFFEGRPTKTPLRYLKIRNHILLTWKSTRPFYVTKTSIRQGLKNCGDVNCISRIHTFLEQTGAINFHCPQTNYIRPMYELFCAIATTNKEKSPRDNKNQSKDNNDLVSRPRFKRKFMNDGEGGYTLTHDEKGDVINTIIVNEEPAKPKNIPKTPIVRLIYCRNFPNNYPIKYSVQLHLSALLLMDFHAHTSLTEVMGLVAGRWDSSKNILTISHYEPCCNIASSATHCDMCPISQSKAANLIHNQGLDILGWFHSHPTFAPEPSQQDLETQQVVQMWVGNKIPSIGVILSPFSSNGALIASPYRCMIVDKKENFEDQFVPYKFNVKMVSGGFDVGYFLKRVCMILNMETINNKEGRINFSKPYFLDGSITYLEKFITSVRMNFAKCGNLDKKVCDDAIQSVTNLFT